jgi:ubiquinone/menaquinone biosynthesis C-methylase UbiE
MRPGYGATRRGEILLLAGQGRASAGGVFRRGTFQYLHRIERTILYGMVSLPPASGPEPRRPHKLEVYRQADYAADYDLRWHGRLGEKRDARKALCLLKALDSAENLCGKSFQTLLDLPCGTGRFTPLFRSRVERYIGVDLSLQMLAQARTKFAQTRYLAADVAQLPFADGSVDVAVCVRFLHLVRSPELRVEFLRELARISKSAVIVDYRHGRTLRVWGKRLRHRLGLLPLAPANPTPTEIRLEIEAAGLTLHKVLAVHRAPLLSDKILLVALPKK